MKPMFRITIIFLTALLMSSALQAAPLTIKANQWQLVAFSKLPQSRSVNDIFGTAATSGQLKAVWAFNNNTKKWTSWPSHADRPNSTLNTLEPGVGYWVKASQDIVVNINNADATIGEMVLYPGWNLVGLAVDNEMPHEQALASVNYLELWKYDVNQNKFLSVQRARGSGIILKEEFSNITPGLGYWIYVAEQTSVLPKMGTLLPPDVDIEPLLNITEYGKATQWTTLSPGDVDWDGDGYFDFPNTQTTVAFGNFLNRQRISLVNEGNGVLSWEATIDPPVNWLLFEAFDENSEPVLTDGAHGSVSDVNGELVLVANRVGLAPNGKYETNVVLRANGAEKKKTIKVVLEVADVVGDYEVSVKLDNIDAKAADLHNPKYFISFARDGEGVKAFLDEERSLLIPQTTYLSGNYIADPQSHFKVLGQLYLPANHEHNPYNKTIRREFALIGQRSDGRDGLPPLDLKGVYSENIYGLFDQPIQLRGEFVARRLSPVPKKTDITKTKNVIGEIPGNATVTFTQDFGRQYSITDIKASVGIEHNDSTKIKYTLTGPDGSTVAKLHNFQSRSIKDLRFDDYDDPVDSLDVFNGKVANGTWKLTVQNTSNLLAKLTKWTLDVSGAKVYQLNGTASPNTSIQLTGCGVILNTTSDAQGKYSFAGLVPCDYDVTVNQFGYQTTSVNVRIEGCVETRPEDCTKNTDYIVNVSQNLQAQPLATSSTLKAELTPKAGMLPAVVKAVDVTNYSAMNSNLQSRTWELYKTNAVIGSGKDMVARDFAVTASNYGGPYYNLGVSFTNDQISFDTLSGAIAGKYDNKITPEWDGAKAKAFNGVELVLRYINNDSVIGHDAPMGVLDTKIHEGFAYPGSFTIDFSTSKFARHVPVIVNGVVTLVRKMDVGRGRIAKMRADANDVAITKNPWIDVNANLANDDATGFTDGVNIASQLISFNLAKGSKYGGKINNNWYGAIATASNGAVIRLYPYQGHTAVMNYVLIRGSHAEVQSGFAYPNKFVLDFTKTRYSLGAVEALRVAVGDSVSMSDASSAELVAEAHNAGHIFTYSIPSKQQNAGVYYAKLISKVQNQSNNAVSTQSYNSDHSVLGFNNLDITHLGIFSVYAGAGTSALKAMDSATFDIDRPPLGGAKGVQDSDSFTATINDATETNALNNIVPVVNQPGQFILQDTGTIDAAVGNQRKHFRIFTSTGQLYQGGSVYGGNYRLDVGVQSQASGEE